MLNKFFSLQFYSCGHYTVYRKCSYQSNVHYDNAIQKSGSHNLKHLLFVKYDTQKWIDALFDGMIQRFQYASSNSKQNES